ncbi:MAG: metal ABC transporter ATP-binding protein [Ruminococcaceae bacterium]|nr:metal ABC transporter ATP-binding protein [Oscillospiraceae bacterium]
MSSQNGCGLCKISVNDVGVKKGKDVLLSSVSFDLFCGQLTALIGVNGAGKTTLLKSILNEIKHDGTVTFESHHGEKIENITIGYVPQHLDFDRSAPVSVEDFMLIGRTNSPVCFKKDKKQLKAIDEALELVGCLELKNKTLGMLSGGEIQRVMLASALYPLPELLILDEPVSGVDLKGSEKFYEVIKNLKKNYHIAIAMVSHDLGIVKEYADNVILINKSVLKSGNAEDVFSSPEFKESFFYGLD